MGKYSPVQVPRGRKYGSNYWETYSIKLDRQVTFYSDLEYKNYLTLEMNPKVVTFCEQPLSVELSICDKKEKTIFDMWAQYEDGYEELQEVKYIDELLGITEKSIRSKHQIEKQNRDYFIKYMEAHSNIKIKEMLTIDIFTEYEILDIVAYFLYKGVITANLESAAFSFDTEVHYGIENY